MKARSAKVLANVSLLTYAVGILFSPVPWFLEILITHTQMRDDDPLSWTSSII
jgi:hypothetical protein